MLTFKNMINISKQIPKKICGLHSKNQSPTVQLSAWPGPSRGSSPSLTGRGSAAPSRGGSQLPSRAPSVGPSRAGSRGPSGTATPEDWTMTLHFWTESIEEIMVRVFWTQNILRAGFLFFIYVFWNLEKTMDFCCQAPPPPPLSPLERPPVFASLDHLTMENIQNYLGMIMSHDLILTGRRKHDTGIIHSLLKDYSFKKPTALTALNCQTSECFGCCSEAWNWLETAHQSVSESEHGSMVAEWHEKQKVSATGSPVFFFLRCGVDDVLLSKAEAFLRMQDLESSHGPGHQISTIWQLELSPVSSNWMVCPFKYHSLSTILVVYKCLQQFTIESNMTSFTWPVCFRFQESRKQAIQLTVSKAPLFTASQVKNKQFSTLMQRIFCYQFASRLKSTNSAFCFLPLVADGQRFRASALVQWFVMHEADQGVGNQHSEIGEINSWINRWSHFFRTMEFTLNSLMVVWNLQWNSEIVCQTSCKLEMNNKILRLSPHPDTFLEQEQLISLQGQGPEVDRLRRRVHNAIEDLTKLMWMHWKMIWFFGNLSAGIQISAMLLAWLVWYTNIYYTALLS